MKDLIDLQHAHATQHGGTGNPWKVEANISNAALDELPGTFTEAQVFEALRFARKFEQLAFEAGIAFQKKTSDRIYRSRIEKLATINQEATNENQRLAAKLMTLIGEKE